MPIEEYVDDIADGFDAVREATSGEEAKLVLMRKQGNGYKVEKIVERGWYPGENSQFFGNTTFHVADITAVFGRHARAATHLMVVDSVIPALNNVVHEKVEGESAPPDTKKPWHRLRGKPRDERIALPAA